MAASQTTRRSFSQRVKRLLRHPLHTLREARVNRQNREWEIYFAAAKKIGSSEKNAKIFADEILGKAIMRSKLKKLIKPTLQPYAKLIRRRQVLKEKLQKWQAEYDRVHSMNDRLQETQIRMRRRVSDKMFDRMLAREGALDDKIYYAKVELGRIVEQLERMHL